MITSLRGKLIKKSPTEITIEANNIGYSVFIPFSTFEKLPSLNSEVFLHTHLIIKEDAHNLFGFYTEEELVMFKLLITVSGIGPKIAQTILSGSKPNEIQNSISNGDLTSLTLTPGIGKKTAERLILELRDKVSKLIPTTQTSLTNNSTRNEAISALISLGYNRQKAENTVLKVLGNNKSKELTIENLLKESLKLLTQE
ncbi:MAG: Holliday junction branch migration protein RuvA [Bacteroidetes bacterium]|nr:Holliday junction branch migration protein RuvA [Bacteroidota bacterium]